MKFTIVALITSIVTAWNQCPTDGYSCAPNPGDVKSLDAQIYAQNNFEGEPKQYTVNGAWGCVDIDDVKIKSAKSTGSTQLTFHYGKGCVGHVVKQVQGGFANVTDDGLCAGSLFIKYNRYGSC